MGRDSLAKCHVNADGVSIHAPRVGRDTCSSAISAVPCCFNPRAPRGARRLPSNPDDAYTVSIHAPRVGRDALQDRSDRNLCFNPRAPRGARPDPLRFHRVQPMHVSIHAPRVGRDASTTFHSRRLNCFNPRAPRGARRVASRCFDTSEPQCADIVSIHAPRVGRDVYSLTIYPTYIVSIHAPRVGRDAWPKDCNHAMCFNPRAPRGARRQLRGNRVRTSAFQSTRPAWGATDVTRAMAAVANVSIHAPRVGRDMFSVSSAPPRRFNPRAPRGARRPERIISLAVIVSIHAPRVGRDRFAAAQLTPRHCFNPRAPRGARRLLSA